MAAKASEVEKVNESTDQTEELTVAQRELQAALAAQVAAANEIVVTQEEPDTDDVMKPVFVYYDEDVDPDELHPSGMLRGTMLQAADPKVAKQFHPKARILNYVDGQPYNARKANKAIRESEDTSDA